MSVAMVMKCEVVFSSFLSRASENQKIEDFHRASTTLISPSTNDQASNRCFSVTRSVMLRSVSLNQVERFCARSSRFRAFYFIRENTQRIQ